MLMPLMRHVMLRDMRALLFTRDACLRALLLLMAADAAMERSAAARLDVVDKSYEERVKKAHTRYASSVIAAPEDIMMSCRYCRAMMPTSPLASFALR